MGNLEERFLRGRERETIVTSGHPDAPVLVKVLRKAISKGNFILRGGRSSKYNFCFDRIYS